MPIFTIIGHILTELFGKSDKWWQIYKQMSSNLYMSNDVSLQNNVLRRKKILEHNQSFIKRQTSGTSSDNE